MDYNLFRASLITCSTGALASSFKIAVTTFCEGACANPSIVRAATASSCTCKGRTGYVNRSGSHSTGFYFVF